MSSTNRSYERQDQDYYVTPAWAIDQLLPALAEDSEQLFGWNLTGAPLRILDPCAGGDDKNEMAYPAGIIRCHQFKTEHVHTIDIREDSRAETKENYLTSPVRGGYDVAISNPPFNLAPQIIIKALKDVRADGIVVMLQRLNFLGSAERKPLFRTGLPFGFGMPVACYVHGKRMRFMQGINPRTNKPWPGDSIEYGHFVWQRGRNPKFTQLRIL